jgi:hypothetical protein
MRHGRAVGLVHARMNPACRLGTHRWRQSFNLPAVGDQNFRADVLLNK